MARINIDKRTIAKTLFPHSGVDVYKVIDKGDHLELFIDGIDVPDCDECVCIVHSARYEFIESKQDIKAV